jgi:hypothetical protein
MKTGKANHTPWSSGQQLLLPTHEILADNFRDSLTLNSNYFTVPQITPRPSFTIIRSFDATVLGY